MRCHYEVLDVPRDADDSDIKAAYRKLALKLHPDKNLENPGFAKEQFQVVQQAYEVLSDRQERAWYDKHREQILRGSNSEFEDNSLDVFQYFTSTCFKSYNDDENGFYTVYRSIFESIAKEDIEYMEEKEEFCEIPNFGNSKTDYEKVCNFYAYWLNYTTKKSYVWLDPYDIRETKDRRYIKLIEKENKKIRQKARKERNEEIRNLVAFVRKRDKRVQAQKKIQEQKLQEDKKKRESLRKQKRLERQQELNESGSQPEWTKFDNVKSELEEIERHLVQEFGEEFSNSEAEEEEEEDFNNLYCVACNKVFKTPKAFENHEFSKKHKENVELLKETMLYEDNFEDPTDPDNLEDYNELKGNYDTEELSEEQLGNSSLQSDSEFTEDLVKKKQKKKKKARNVLSVAQDTKGSVKIEDNSLNQKQFDDFDFNSSKKPKNKKKTKAEQASNNSEEKLDAQNTTLQDTTSVTKSKKKSKKELETDVIDVDHSCVTCKFSFPSKNKLFDHLKKTGHGVYIPSNLKNKNNKKKSVKEK